MSTVIPDFASAMKAVEKLLIEISMKYPDTEYLFKKYKITVTREDGKVFGWKK